VEVEGVERKKKRNFGALAWVQAVGCLERLAQQ
jgi:hypothetical protein